MSSKICHFYSGMNYQPIKIVVLEKLFQIHSEPSARYQTDPPKRSDDLLISLSCANMLLSSRNHRPFFLPCGISFGCFQVESGANFIWQDTMKSAYSFWMKNH